MTRLLLGNIEPGTSDEEIRAFLEKYGFPAFDGLEHEPGDGSRPAVLLTYEGVDPAAMTKLLERIHNMFWKNRRLNAMILKDRYA